MSLSCLLVTMYFFLHMISLNMPTIPFLQFPADISKSVYGPWHYLTECTFPQTTADMCDTVLVAFFDLLFIRHLSDVIVFDILTTNSLVFPSI